MLFQTANKRNQINWKRTFVAVLIDVCIGFLMNVLESSGVNGKIPSPVKFRLLFQ